MTLDEAVALIAEKAAKGGGGKKPFRKAAARAAPKARPRSGKADQEGRRTLGAQHFRTQTSGDRDKPVGKAPASKADFRPSRDEILQFIAENPDRSGKRDIAKAFSLKGDDRIWLKDMLRDLQDEGLLQKERKRLIRAGALPHVVVLDIFGRDADGGLLAQAGGICRRRAERRWFRSACRAAAAARRPASATGVLAKMFPTDEATGPAYTGRVDEDVREAQGRRSRRLPHAQGRHVPDRAGRTPAARADRRAGIPRRRQGRRPRRGRAGACRPLRPAARQGASRCWAR